MNAKGTATFLLLSSLLLGLTGCRPQTRVGAAQPPPAAAESPTASPTGDLGTTSAQATPGASTPASTGTTDTTGTADTPDTGAGAAPDALGLEAGARLQSEQNTIDVVQRFEPGLVYISTEQQVSAQDPFGMMGGDTQVQQGVGSGFFVNGAGDILTNFHVVAGEGGWGTSKVSIRVMNQDRSVEARVIGYAPQYDLALIRAEGLDRALIRPIPLGDSDALKVGQKAIAMGAPFGLDFSVSEGIVTATRAKSPSASRAAARASRKRPFRLTRRSIRAIPAGRC